jgi:hypothetical protein
MKAAPERKMPAPVRKLLTAAREAGSPATLIVRLEDAASLTPGEVRQTADELIAEAAQASGEEAQRLKVLENLGCITISAPAAFLESLSRSPRVASVQPADSGVTLIAPVRRGKANPKGWAR